MEKSPIALSVEMDWQKECRIKPNGVTVTSQNGLSRLTNVTQQSIGEGLLKWASLTPTEVRSIQDSQKWVTGETRVNLAQTLIQCGITPTGEIDFSDGVSDVIVTGIIKHYAWRAGRHCTEQAQKLDMVLTAVAYRQLVYRQLAYDTPLPTSKLIGIQRENDALRQELARLEAENKVYKLRSEFALPVSKSVPRVSNEESEMMTALKSCGFPMAAIARFCRRAYQTVRRHAV